MSHTNETDQLKASLVVNMMHYFGVDKSQAKTMVNGCFDGEHTIRQNDLPQPTKTENK